MIKKLFSKKSVELTMEQKEGILKTQLLEIEKEKEERAKELLKKEEVKPVGLTEKVDQIQSTLDAVVDKDKVGRVKGFSFKWGIRRKKKCLAQQVLAILSQEVSQVILHNQKTFHLEI